MSKYRIVKLGDVLKYEQPTKYIVSNTTYDDNYNIPVLTAGKTFILGYTNETENIFTKIPVIIFDDFTTSTKFVDFPFKVKSSAMKMLNPTDDIDIKYIFYVISTIKSDKGLHKRYWISKYANIKIPLPPLEKQKEIASILDKAQELISLRKESIKKLDELSKSIFIDMFGDPVSNPKKWKLNNLSEFGNCKNGLNFNSKINKCKIKCLGVGDFKNLTTIRNIESLPTISIDKKPTKEYLLQNGDIIFVRSNGSKNLVGRCIEIYPDEQEITFSGFCIRFRLSNNLILIPYLLHLLKTKSIRQNMVGRGANIQNLNQQILLGLKIPLPPIELQNKFAKTIEKIEEQKSLYEEELEKLEENFKALLQKSFS